MFYLQGGLLSWSLAFYFIRWRSLRQLLLFGLAGSLLGVTNDLLSVLGGGLWVYRDQGFFDSHFKISLLIAASIAPLLAMYFVQDLRPGGPLPWLRIVAFTALALVPETVALHTGHLTFGRWWTFGWSTAAYVVTWLGFWFLHRWVTAAPPADRLPDR